MKVECLKKKLKVSSYFNNIQLDLTTKSRFIFRLGRDYLNCLTTQNQSKKLITPKLKIRFYFNEIKSNNSSSEKDSQGPVWANINRDKLYLDSFTKSSGLSVDTKKNIVRGYITPFHQLSEDIFLERFFFQPLSFILRHKGLFFIHAACVSKTQKGILIPGRMGSGKSTFTISLVRQGFNFLSEDKSILRKIGNDIYALAFPRKAGIIKKTARFFPELKSVEFKFDQARREEKGRFIMQEFYPQSLLDSAKIRLIIFPHFQTNGRTKIKPLSKKEALQKFIQDTDNFAFYNKDSLPKIYRQYFAVLTSLVQQAVTYQIFYSDKDIDCLSQIVNSLLISNEK